MPITTMTIRIPVTRVKKAITFSERLPEVKEKALLLPAEEELKAPDIKEKIKDTTTTLT